MAGGLTWHWHGQQLDLSKGVWGWAIISGDLQGTPGYRGVWGKRHSVFAAEEQEPMDDKEEEAVGGGGGHADQFPSLRVRYSCITWPSAAPARAPSGDCVGPLGLTCTS